MRNHNPFLLLLSASILLLVGFTLPALMIMQVFESTFALNLAAYSASFLGLVLGLLGSLALAIRRRRTKDE